MQTRRAGSGARWRAAAAVLLALGVCAGCSTQRTLRIESEPPGARIWVNGKLQKTRTPVDVPFTHYGRFDVRLEKQGYKSVAAELHVPTQLDGYPVIDLPLEMITPEKRFRRVVRMERLQARPQEADLKAAWQRGETMRAETHRAVGEPGTPGRQSPGIVRP